MDPAGKLTNSNGKIRGSCIFRDLDLAVGMDRIVCAPVDRFQYGN